ncbi:MAG: tRNA epoxyqueuosine(34) reductase QueG [Bacteroidaceae bacterium]|nr:tRNA epoxyqueuosine(34) reductase QueG [Bacteroidaceae bacterium]
MEPTSQIEEVKALALGMGFTACGVARAESIDPSCAVAFREWLDQGRNAGMAYLQNHEDKRLDPRRLLEGAQSVICVALNYYPKQLLSPDQLQFAYYAYGHDYHDVMRSRLGMLASALGMDPLSMGKGRGEAFKLCCDTVPMLDRYWAWRAGLGWIGRNKNLILPHHGSYFFLGEIITTRRFDHYDEPIADHCGTCDRCLRACPTGALTQTDDGQTTLDARRCLSYLTIEHRGDLSPDTASAMGNCIYGCDRCQQACPYNRNARPTDVADFEPTDDFLHMQPKDWQQLTPEQYRRLFRGSAVKRAKYEGLRRNIDAIGIGPIHPSHTTDSPL